MASPAQEWPKFLIVFLGISFLTRKNFPNSNQGINRTLWSSAFEGYLGWHLGSFGSVVVVNGVLGPRLAQISDCFFREFRSSLGKTPQTATRASLERSGQALLKDTLVGIWGLSVQ
jgi:hypothetical protein